jgi:hypothetical protein
MPDVISARVDQEPVAKPEAPGDLRRGLLGARSAATERRIRCRRRERHDVDPIPADMEQATRRAARPPRSRRGPPPHRAGAGPHPLAEPGCSRPLEPIREFPGRQVEERRDGRQT